ncbi:MAG: DUF1501 domain-containing protein [Gemmataceae bacterium]|nr:DUF1501 domain-containing protein [Gemmataceae bacterium]
MMQSMQKFSRRGFLAGTAGLYLAGPSLAKAVLAKPNLGKAEHCVYIWLGGGIGQTDSFDPKKLGDAKKKIPGSYYKAIDTAVQGVRVCEHLEKSARIMDRMTAIRSINHDVIDEHAAAVNRMHTGRPVSGTAVYPSVGSIVSHQRGPGGDAAPTYVLIGYPNITRGPGFLGAAHNFLYLTDTESGPAGLSRPEFVTPARSDRRQALLRELRRVNSLKGPSREMADYEAALEQSIRLAGPSFNRVFKLDEEPASLRQAYGGEFGQRCLLARRLIERGTRFIEVSHNLNFVNGTGWDVHNEGILNQHLLIRELDQALAALITDLEKRKLLDKTLVAISTEFGRPPEFDGGGGRGHQSKAFSVLLAGGGLRHRGAHGETDELAKKVVKDPVSVADFFATIHAAMGINPEGNLYDGDRPVPITDGGKAILLG